MKAKIYVLKNPFTNEVKYVGCTTTTLKSRLSQHIYDAKTKNNPKSKWIELIINHENKPIIELLEEVEFKDWKEREKYWIEYYSKNDLVNSKVGGSGLVIERTLESITRSSEAKEIEVIQLDKLGNQIKIWESAKKASDELEILNTAIGNNLNGRSKSAGGFIWKYKEDLNVPIKYKNNRYSKVIQLDDNNIQINEFASINEAIEYLQISRDSIRRVCNGTSKIKGLKLRYGKDIV